MAKQKRQRRTFTLEDKQKILAEVEAGNKLVDVAKKYKMQPAQLSQWKSKYGAGGGSSSSSKKKAPAKGAKRGGRKKATTSAPAPAATAGRPATRVAASSNSNITIAELERMIGRLTVENAMLRRQLEDAK